MLKKSIHRILPIFLLLFWFLIPLRLRGQESKTEVQRYVWFDNIIGQTNSGIFKGLGYVNEYRVVNDRHQFFISTDFKSGSVTYDDQTYFDVPLRYDVYLDDLLLLNDELSDKPIMLFDKRKVSEFNIGEDSFEFISSRTSNEQISGFFEVLVRKRL